MANLVVEQKTAGVFTWAIHADGKKASSVSIGSNGKGTTVSSVLKCENVAVGQPSPASGFVAVIETRYFFEGDHFYSLGAIAPRFEYRQAKKLKVLELPIIS